jgi:hypothetical protein
MTINDLTDAQLAGMVRNSIYAKNTSFGDGETDCRFLLVLAIPYGRDEDVETLPDAIEAFATFLQEADWKERDFQVYDHAAPQHFYSATMEQVELNEDESPVDDHFREVDYLICPNGACGNDGEYPLSQAGGYCSDCGSPLVVFSAIAREEGNRI